MSVRNSLPARDALTYIPRGRKPRQAPLRERPAPPEADRARRHLSPSGPGAWSAGPEIRSV